jgi:hypothetical protein
VDHDFTWNETPEFVWKKVNGNNPTWRELFDNADELKKADPNYAPFDRNHLKQNGEPKKIRVPAEKPVFKRTSFDAKKSAISWDACVDYCTEIYGRWSVDTNAI